MIPMKLRSKAGFTLVELIVVIAILAILAGVAIPVYSGYVTKANEAADTQIVSAMNTAFAAACVENGFSNTDFANDNGATKGVAVTVTNNKVASIAPTTVKSGVTITDAQKTAIADSFNEYFASNKDTALKYYGSFTFADGNFTGVKAS